MKNLALTGAIALAMVSTAKAEPAKLEVTVSGFKQGESIPEKYAFCVPDAKFHSADGGNVNPGVSWSKGPEGTKSYALIVHDTDVPTVFTDAGKEGRTISKDLPRMDFYHWVLIDIPADRTEIKEGEDSSSLKKTGKIPERKPYGVTGINDFGSFMEGTFGGYDGPCPPWNDEIIHHYHFTVYALDVPSLKIADKFSGNQAIEAMKGHVLASGSVTGTYTQNQALLKK